MKNFSARTAAFSMVNSLLVMDICTIGFIKDREKIPLRNNEKKKARLDQLISIAKSGSYKFSFILAIVEKATDVQNPMSCKEMTERFLRDYREILGLIGSNNMAESTTALKGLIKILMDDRYSVEERAEVLLPEYLRLLKFYNELDVITDPAKAERLPLAKKITDYAAELGISPGHPVVTVCVASVYGCKDARKILKVNSEGEFNPSNALGDIQTFYRMANVRHLVSGRYPGMKVVFRTEDEALENMHTYYKAVVLHKLDNAPLYAIPEIDNEKMFPLLFSKKNGSHEAELDELYQILNFKKNNN